MSDIALEPRTEVLSQGATTLATSENNSPATSIQTFSGHLKAYLRSRDPTEYTFAIQQFGSWSAWEEFLKQEWVGPIIDKWRKEMTVKLRSESLARIMEAAQGETRDALAANKYIFESLEEDNKKVGRPTKEAILREANKLVGDNTLREEAYNRLYKEDK